MNRIVGSASTIKVLLNNRYSVPYFQREYNWEKKQIEELIEDLTSEFLEYYQDGDTQRDVANYGNYFLGPIILTGDNAIIDGQQRLSSITLMLIFLNNLQKRSQIPKVNIDNLIYSEDYGQKTFTINVAEREKCLYSLFETGDYDITNENSESVKNLYNRYKDIEDSFPDNIKGEVLPLFIEWLKNNVVLIEIRTDTEQDAHKVFVTMNDRGLRLSPVEMLKGFLLSEIRDDRVRAKANEFWKDTVLKLKDIEKDGDANFIKNWLRAQYAMTIRERKEKAVDKDFEIIGSTLHKWVREKSDIIGLNRPEDFERFVLKEFKMFADIYLRLKEYSKKFTKEYEYIYYNADRGFTLQYQLILAAIKPDDTYDIINKKIKLVSCFIDQFISLRVFNFKTVDYSSILYSMFLITKAIRRKGLDELLQYTKDFINNMEYDFNGIDSFYLNQFTKRFMLHILSRMTYYIEKKSGLNTSFQNYVDRECKNPYDIEHIWADDYTQGNHQQEFPTEEEFKIFRNRFGGLLVLTKDKNRSFQDMEYAKKVLKYDSENLLARTLNSNCYHNNPLFLNFMRQSALNFKPYNHFNKADLIERQSLYKELCKEVWNIRHLDECLL